MEADIVNIFGCEFYNYFSYKNDKIITNLVSLYYCKSN